MDNVNTKCPHCDAEMIIDKEISSIVCGCCMSDINTFEVLSRDEQFKPSNFLVRNDVLEGYYGEASRGIRTPPGVKVIGNYAFGAGAMDVYVSDGVEELKAYSFINCTYLMYLRLPDSVKILENILGDHWGDVRAIDLEQLTRINPVKPCIECTEKVKRLILDSYNEESIAKYEEKITWK